MLSPGDHLRLRQGADYLGMELSHGVLAAASINPRAVVSEIEICTSSDNFASLQGHSFHSIQAYIVRDAR
jgi:hypothetical protein